MQVIFSDRFEDELFEIANFIALHSPRRADLFIDEIEKHCQNLVNMPYRYRKSPKFHSDNVRDLIVKGFVIPYLVGNDCITILGIYKENAWEA